MGEERREINANATRAERRGLVHDAEMRTVLKSWHVPVQSTCKRIIAVQVPRRHAHNSNTGDLTKFIPNVAVVDKTPSTALTPHTRQPTERYKDLLEEYSTKGVARFAALKKRAANLAPMRTTENPQFVLQNKLFAEIVTDLSKYDLEKVDPYLMILQSTTHEERVEAQRVVCAIMKMGKHPSSSLPFPLPASASLHLFFILLIFLPFSFMLLQFFLFTHFFMWKEQ